MTVFKGGKIGESKSETTGPAEWVRGSDPAALGLLFLRLAAHLMNFFGYYPDPDRNRLFSYVKKKLQNKNSGIT